MAKVFKFEDDTSNSMAGELSHSLREKFMMLVPNQMVGNLYRVFFRSFALMAKYNSNKKLHKVGFSFKNDKGEFVIGTILTYVNGEDSEDEGHWNLSMSFNEDDMKDCDELFDTFNSAFLNIVQTELYVDINAHCASNEDLIKIITEFMNAIKLFLDKNSNDTTEDVSLIMNSVFEATVSIVNGEKVFTIVPGYSVKQIVKNDDEAEKKD